ncbi:hypothetical protein [Bifidobacterium moukalabense]|uniref:hypothetical protein n=1 Tax=Bifidobacterium moukalabense TaxID=1333651 RepID=UPI0010F8DF5C|nr:hypothetical protein [Bifidobacterium moukalabense]
MNDHIANEQDRNDADRIRRQYANPETDPMNQLRKLDDAVKRPGLITSLTLGIIGALIMGAGMALVMSYDNMTLGLVLGIPGLIILAAAYPIGRAITSQRKARYADDILRLSNQILHS